MPNPDIHAACLTELSSAAEFLQCQLAVLLQSSVHQAVLALQVPTHTRVVECPVK